MFLVIVIGLAAVACFLLAILMAHEEEPAAIFGFSVIGVFLLVVQTSVTYNHALGYVASEVVNGERLEVGVAYELIASHEGHDGFVCILREPDGDYLGYLMPALPPPCFTVANVDGKRVYLPFPKQAGAEETAEKRGD